MQKYDFTYTKLTNSYGNIKLFLQQWTTLKLALASIVNIQFEYKSWTQATLPIRFSRLCNRKISDLALPAFLSSVHSIQSLAKLFLKSNSLDLYCLSEARIAGSVVCPGTDYPQNPTSQRQWDEPLCKLTREKIIETSVNSVERARLLASGEWESGLWLQALPSANIGTLLDRTASALQPAYVWALPVTLPTYAIAGVRLIGSATIVYFVFVARAGRIPCHAGLNDIIRRALTIYT